MSGKNRLLVVDDELMNRDMLSRRLERAGYAVDVAADAREALERLEDDQIELILLDSMMPGMSGVDLLRLLRGTYTQAELPIIMVTALSDSTRVVEALNLGANDYITKPIDFSVALARIQSQIARKRAEDSVRDSEQRYALAARGSTDGLWDWDLTTNRLFLSERWKQMLALADSDMGPDPAGWMARIHPADRPAFQNELDALRRPGGPAQFSGEYRLLHASGAYRWMLTRGFVLRDQEGNAVRMSGSQTDITTSRAFDSLTGLPNRVFFTDRLENAIARAAGGAAPYAVLFLDMDRFKVVNDSLGHQAGDRLLVELANRLLQAMESAAPALPSGAAYVIARLGGDEFAILVEGAGDAAVMRPLAERIEGAVREPFTLENRELFASISIGIALGAPEYSNAAEVLRDADTAMYRAKSLGRSRWAIFDSEMRAMAVARMEMESDLRHAIGRDELRLYYQPKVELGNNRVVGFEALLRWQHPTRGLIPPLQFIPLAEETGLIVPIGAWVIREACIMLRRWQKEFPFVPPLEMSVNLSVRQFWQNNLVGQVADALAETGLDPECLQLEVTESVFVQEPVAAASVLAELKGLGVGLKLDDFGTGYSSLSYLSQLPCDSLKIDKSFVNQMCTDISCSEIIRTVVQLANSLGKQVIAEGIETEAQAELLKSLGCGFGQGYLFSKPMAAEKATAYLKAIFDALPG
ncbi:MAG: EAL domain-containing protein [Bryobacteraceae bacterium]|nr:EAL domain-containing protein [Bryobacteraceae bacterium]